MKQVNFNRLFGIILHTKTRFASMFFFLCRKTLNVVQIEQLQGDMKNIKQEKREHSVIAVLVRYFSHTHGLRSYFQSKPNGRYIW